MILIQLQGGLGNQMFQYAFAKILAESNKDLVVVENSFFDEKEKREGFTPRKFELGIFNNHYLEATNLDIQFFNHLSLVNRIKRKLGLNYPKRYNEPSFGFQAHALTIKSPVYLKGYFQSYKYFLGYEDLIRTFFSFPTNKLDSRNKELLSTFKNQNTIAIHIRRGDYVTDKLTQQFHGNCSLEYYYGAITELQTKNKDFTLVFFSDDSDWVKEQFGDLPYSKIFVDHNKNEDSWKDMFLMSSCQHNIIANSSFSWWAAWLNTNPEKVVVAPKEWFATNKKTNDLIPSEWIRL
ncbi:alpha-1,2-fucosyltransferase [Flavobacterium eburneipallidum]|uniref:alpha-1,2-fucosyltransferase n=1 Tax=Flavobacterium eburneipallidum TaxID=3003263 RepID=UPI002482322D|nr:alpha-1,2-fucosyltransferase [Flavobacterium eburneipallidum]